MRSLRERLDNKEVLIGPISLIGSPIVVEIFGHLAFDLLFIDTEHAPTSPYGTELEAMLRAAAAANIPAIVRPTEPRPGAILKALNFGAQGIWVTHVQSRADAEAAAAACRYPPDGSRSAVPTNRSAKYGVEDWDTYRVRVNRETLVLPIVESRKGIQNVEEIAATPGVDVIQFGPFDLSVDLGLPPGNFFGTDKQWVHPDLEEAMKIHAARLPEARQARGRGGLERRGGRAADRDGIPGGGHGNRYHHVGRRGADGPKQTGRAAPAAKVALRRR